MNLSEKIITKTKRLYKNALTDLKETASLNEKKYRNARGARIITYHGICIKNHLKFNTIFLQLKTFAAHLQFYKKNFNVLSLDDYYSRNFSDKRFNICICFDDGFYNNYKYVLPLLTQYKIPATFFITAIRNAGYDILWNDFLSISTKYGPKEIIYDNQSFCKNRNGIYIASANGKSLADIMRLTDFKAKAGLMQQLSFLTNFRENKENEDFWLQMTEQQIEELSHSEFCSIGAHGYFHNDLAKINPEKAEEEIIKSKQYLESLTQKEVKSLAFPYGSYSSTTLETAKKAGYTQLLALDFMNAADHTDEMLRERIIINPYISIPNQMHAIINGKYA